MTEAVQLGAGSSQGSLSPVVFKTELVETGDRIESNIRSCLSQPYLSFNHLLAKPFQKSMSIVGSAPSIHWTWKHVVGDIIACNAAHDFLIKKKITPKYGMLWDPVEVLNDFITPNDHTTYLIASRCHPKLFKRFEGRKVVVWHADGDLRIKELLQEYKKLEPVVMGGSTGVTRSLFLAVAMGYLDLHIFGGDSSCDEGSHIRKSVVDEEYMQIFAAGRWFKTTPWLAVQAEDFQKLAPYLSKVGVSLTIYGDGLIPHIAKQLGFPVYDNPQGITSKGLIHVG